MFLLAGQLLYLTAPTTNIPKCNNTHTSKIKRTQAKNNKNARNWKRKPLKSYVSAVLSVFQHNRTVFLCWFRGRLWRIQRRLQHSDFYCPPLLLRGGWLDDIWTGSAQIPAVHQSRMPDSTHGVIGVNENLLHIMWCVNLHLLIHRLGIGYSWKDSERIGKMMP